MERLTVHSAKGLKLRKGKKFVELFADKSLTLNALNRLAELEDKLESGQLVDTTPYIEEIKSEIPFKYKVIKPTMHRRNVEMCDSKESAEACLKKLEVRYANKT